MEGYSAGLVLICLALWMCRKSDSVKPGPGERPVAPKPAPTQKAITAQKPSTPSASESACSENLARATHSTEIADESVGPPDQGPAMTVEKHIKRNAKHKAWFQYNEDPIERFKRELADVRRDLKSDAAGKSYQAAKAAADANERTPEKTKIQWRKNQVHKGGSSVRLAKSSL